METKEQILEHELYLARVVTDGKVNEKEAILRAMERYAKQEAEMFAIYASNYLESNGVWFERDVYQNITYTTEQLMMFSKRRLSNVE